MEAGAPESWSRYFGRCQQMGFDTVLAAPVFAPGAQGEIFLTGDHEHVNGLIGRSADTGSLVANVAEQCAQHGLALLLDVVVGRVASDADLVRLSPRWFDIAADRRIDPRTGSRQLGAAYIRFDEPSVATAAADWWVARLRDLARAGISGFRCLEPQLVPASVWRHIIAAVQQEFPECRFLAWTPGLDWGVLRSFEDVGFAAVFSSLPWWDGCASWFIEEHEILRRIGRVISAPEAPFGPRLARRLEDVGAIPAHYRHMLRCAASTGVGMLVPMGFEYACTEDMQTHPAANDGFATLQGAGNVDLTSEISEANALSTRLVQRGLSGELRIVGASRQSIALVRSDAEDARRASEAAVVLINNDFLYDSAVPISLRPLPAAAGAPFSTDETLDGEQYANPDLHPGEVRVLHAHRNRAIIGDAASFTATKLSAAKRIAIESISPSVDTGRFSAKRIIGESVEVEADVFTDGHDVLVAELLWRAADESEWRRAEMRALGNDRWQAAFMPERIGRYEFTIEAWIDKYGSLCRDLEIKTGADPISAAEIAEGRQLLESAKRAQGDQAAIIHTALSWLTDESPQTCEREIFSPHRLCEK